MIMTQDMRIMSKVLIGDDCWEWGASHDLDGYGVAWFDNRQQGAHRAVWQLFNGPIPESLHLDHLCRNKGCVKFTHLEIVTNQENNRRSLSPSGINAKKTHCINNHELSGKNLYVHPKRGTRHCRTCQRVRSQRGGGGSNSPS